MCVCMGQAHIHIMCHMGLTGIDVDGGDGGGGYTLAGTIPGLRDDHTESTTDPGMACMSLSSSPCMVTISTIICSQWCHLS